MLDRLVSLDLMLEVVRRPQQGLVFRVAGVRTEFVNVSGGVAAGTCSVR